MNRMITRITVLSVLAVSSVAVNAQETESVSFGRTVWNNFKHEVSRLNSLLSGQSAQAPEAAVVVEVAPVASAVEATIVSAPVVEAAIISAPAAEVAQVKAPHFIKRAARTVIAGTKTGVNTVTSSFASVGNKLSSGFVSTGSYIKAHPVKVAAYVASAVTISGIAGYGIYTYNQQNNQAAQN